MPRRSRSPRWRCAQINSDGPTKLPTATSLCAESADLFDNDGSLRKPSSSRSPSIYLASKLCNATSTVATQGDVAAMRHLQSIIKSMAANNALPPLAFDQSSDKKVANNFEQLPENAEKRIHFHKRKKNNGPLQLRNTPELATVVNSVGRKNKGWLKARFVGKKRHQMQQQQQHRRV